MPNTSNYNWPTPADTDLVKDGAAAIRDLGDGVDTSLVDLLGGTTGQVLTKASNTDLDFSFTTPSGSPLTTKGDLYTFGTGDTRLPVGANGTILQADSVETTGLKWVSKPSIGMTFIARTTFSNVASQAFDGVFTSTYKNYLVVIDEFFSVSGNAITMQLRYAGPTTQASNYYGNNIYSRSNTSSVTNDNTNNAATFKVLPTSGSSTVPTRGFFYISGVGNASERANFNGMINDEQNSYGGSFNGCSTVARTYTGFIIQTATNITGAVTIYGLAAA